MKKIVLAIDSFKGSLTSAEAEAAALEGIRRVYPQAEIVCIPIADGGEGMLEALSALRAQEVRLRVQGPLDEKVEARYLISSDGQTAYIEMASASGLPLVPENQRNPLLTTTRGTGELMRDALDRGCNHLVIGLGGSATNDGGMGMLSALGIRFLDRQGQELEGRGCDMEETDRIDTSFAHPALKAVRCTAACDVRNPFYAIRSTAPKVQPISSLHKKVPAPTRCNSLTKACATWPNSTGKRQDTTLPPYPVLEPQEDWAAHWLPF